MSKKRESLARRRLLPGTASDFIGHIDEIQPGDGVVICCRVSTRQQDRRGNLADQETNLRRIVSELGAIVLHVVKHVGSGTEPVWLIPAARLAKAAGAVLLAESTSRFIRHPGYHSSNWPTARARNYDLEDLQSWTDGVQLITVLPPDATSSDETAFQSKRGQELKENAGGRPRKTQPRGKERRAAYVPLAVEMRKAEMTYRQIAAELNGIDDGFPDVSHATMGNWLRAEERKSGADEAV
jgi:hypothetical protein